jgi:hypothetical protein
LIKEFIIAFINLSFSIHLLMCPASGVTAALVAKMVLVVKLAFYGAGAPGCGDEEVVVVKKDALWGVWDVFRVSASFSGKFLNFLS